MSIQAETVNNFLENIVKEGLCSSTREAKKQLSSKLAEMELDRNLAKGEADIEAGRYEEVNEETNKKLLAEIAQELFPQNN